MKLNRIEHLKSLRLCTFRLLHIPRTPPRGAVAYLKQAAPAAAATSTATSTLTPTSSLLASHCCRRCAGYVADTKAEKIYISLSLCGAFI